MVNRMELESKIFNNSGTFKIEKSCHIKCLKGLDFSFELDAKETNIELDFDVEENANVELRILNYKEEKALNLHGKVCKNSIFNVYLADFSENLMTVKSIVDLDEEGANSTFKFSTLSDKEIIKNYDISFNHNTKKTKSLLEGYGVAEDTSSIIVNGVSHIKKDCAKCKTAQKIKVILFDKFSKATTNPVLKIDCEDIEASHACAIGNLNEDHIFYLLSRGIELKEARKLITLGYLNPIKNYFPEDQKEFISSLIERNM